MKDGITLRVKRAAGYRTLPGEFEISTVGNLLYIVLTLSEIGMCAENEIDITLEPVKSREERLREARTYALVRYFGEFGEMPDSAQCVNIIERVDAEFAKGEK